MAIKTIEIIKRGQQGATGETGTVDTTQSYEWEEPQLFESDVSFNSTGAIKIPVGTTSERPGLVRKGDMRYNDTIGKVEIYNGTLWTTLDGSTLPPSQTTSIILNPNTTTLNIAGTTQITVQYVPSNSTDTDVSFASSDVNVATVSSTGLITAVTSGTCIITGSLVSDPTITSTVTVNSVDSLVPVTGVVISPSIYNLNVGDSITLNANITPNNATNNYVLWATSTPSVMSISNVEDLSCTVTALRDGTGNITGTSANSIVGNSTITVSSDVIEPTNIFIDRIVGNPSKLQETVDYYLDYVIAPDTATNKNASIIIRNSGGTVVDDTIFTQDAPILTDTGGTIVFRFLAGSSADDYDIRVLSTLGSIESEALILNVSTEGDTAEGEVNIGNPVIPPSGTTYDVFFMAGQSNMVGRGDWQLVGEFPPIGTSYTLDGDKTTLRNTTNTFIHPSDNSNGCMFTAFARNYYTVSGRKCIIVPVAKGGIRVDQSSPGTPIYNAYITQYNTLMTLATQYNISYDTINFCWHQGENDQYNYGLQGDIVTYNSLLLEIWDTLQLDTNSGFSNFFMHRVGIYPPDDGDVPQLGWNILRAQSLLCIRRPLDIIPGYLSCASFYGTENESNGIHYGQVGYNKWGTESAQIAYDYIVNDNKLDVLSPTDDLSFTDVWGAVPDFYLTVDNDGEALQKNLNMTDITLALDESHAITSSSSPIPIINGGTITDTNDWSIAVNFNEFYGSGSYIKFITGANSGDWLWMDNSFKISDDVVGRSDNPLDVTQDVATTGVVSGSMILITCSNGTITMYDMGNTSINAPYGQVGAIVVGTGTSIDLRKVLNTASNFSNMSIKGIAMSSTGIFAPYSMNYLLYNTIVTLTTTDKGFNIIDNGVTNQYPTDGSAIKISQTPTYTSNGNLLQDGFNSIFIPNITYNDSDDWSVNFRIESTILFSDLTSENYPGGVVEYFITFALGSVSGSNLAVVYWDGTSNNGSIVVRFRLNGVTLNLNVDSIYQNVGNVGIISIDYNSTTSELVMYLDGVEGARASVSPYTSITFSSPFISNTGSLRTYAYGSLRLEKQIIADKSTVLDPILSTLSVYQVQEEDKLQRYNESLTAVRGMLLDLTGE